MLYILGVLLLRETGRAARPLPGAPPWVASLALLVGELCEEDFLLGEAPSGTTTGTGIPIF